MSDDQITAVLNELRQLLEQRVAPFPRMFGQLQLTVDVANGQVTDGAVKVTTAETWKRTSKANHLQRAPARV